MGAGSEVLGDDVVIADVMGERFENKWLMQLSLFPKKKSESTGGRSCLFCWGVACAFTFVPFGSILTTTLVRSQANGSRRSRRLKNGSRRHRRKRGMRRMMTRSSGSRSSRRTRTTVERDLRVGDIMQRRLLCRARTRVCAYLFGQECWPAPGSGHVPHAQLSHVAGVGEVHVWGSTLEGLVLSR